MLIGEVGFITRSMFRNRSGLPRSCTSATSDPPTAPNAPTLATVAARRRPVSWDPAPSREAPPARPPRKK